MGIDPTMEEVHPMEARPDDLVIKDQSVKIRGWVRSVDRQNHLIKVIWEGTGMVRWVGPFGIKVYTPVHLCPLCKVGYRNEEEMADYLCMNCRWG